MNEQTSNTAAATETIAAVDLGSNSFHMIVGKLDNKQLVIVDRLRDAVRLGGGLTNDRNLSDEAWERALESLSRMGQRLRALPHHAVRAVGTNTMRQIRDGGAFLRAAEDALGHPIEIIGGREEARLVYLGVAHGLAAGNESRLVVDIGGGSTEVILGEGLQARERESLFMGCVSMTVVRSSPAASPCSAPCSRHWTSSICRYRISPCARACCTNCWAACVI